MNIKREKSWSSKDILTGILSISLVFMTMFNIKLTVEAESIRDKNIKLEEKLAISKTVAGMEFASAIGQTIRAKDDEIQTANVEETKTELTLYERAGQEWNIDHKLLEAIERLETGHYTSDLFKYHNNTWGARTNSGWMHFDSQEQSTMTLAKNLRLYYFDQGLTDVYSIAYKYCPDNPNTPNDEAAEWAWSVNSIYNTL